MSNDINPKPTSKSSKRETVYVAGCHIDKELNDELLALARGLEMNAEALTQNTVGLIKSYENRHGCGLLMDVRNRLDSVGAGLRKLQRKILEQKALRNRWAAKRGEKEKPD